MAHQMTANEITTDNMQCVLSGYNCKQSFPEADLDRHILSEIHFLSIIQFLYEHHFNVECSMISSSIVADPPSEQNPLIKDFSQFLKDLTSSLFSRFPSLTLSDRQSSLSANATSQLIEKIRATRDSILGMDQNPNHDLLRQGLRNEYQTARMMMGEMERRFDSTNDDDDDGNEDDTCPYGESDSNDHDFSLIPEHNHTRKPHTIESILQSFNKYEYNLNDGQYIWHIDNVNEKITNAISRKEPCYTSTIISTMNSHRFFIRLYLNGKTDPKFISIDVYLDFPFISAFRARFQIVLVDQSENSTLNHITKEISVNLKNVNDYCGLDKFVDKNLLHQDPSLYIKDDSIDIIVNVQQNDEEKYNNLPPNIRNALIQLHQHITNA